MNRLLTLLPVLLIAAACARRETPVQSGDRDQVLHLGNLSEPQDLDPHTVTGVQEFYVMSAILEGLVNEDPKDLHPVPGAAASWDVSPDGLTYTFRLQPDGRWSNGDPVTAHDFVFAFRRILSPKLGAPYAYMLHVLRGAKAYNLGETADFSAVGARAIDDRTLELTLAAPVPYFLALIAHNSWFPVHPPTILRFGTLDQIGTPWTKPANFVGNGPFTLADWQPGDRIAVRKSATYWDRDRVRLNAVNFYAIGDNNIEERAYRAGQLHVTGTVPLDRIAHYRTTQPDRLQLTTYLGTYYYLFNVNRPPLNDVRVRRALALAVNREDLVNYVTQGGETPAYHFTPPDTAGFTAQARLPADTNAASALLAEAGFPGGRDFPRLELLYNSSDQHARIAQAVQQMWKETLGIEVALVNMEWKVYVAQTQEQRYDIARHGWIGDYPDPNTFLDMWVTGGGNNRTGWTNADYDALIAAAAKASSPAERRECFQRAEEILVRETPIMPLYFYKSKALVAPSVRNWHPNILNHHPLKFVYLEPLR